MSRQRGWRSRGDVPMLCFQRSQPLQAQRLPRERGAQQDAAGNPQPGQHASDRPIAGFDTGRTNDDVAGVLANRSRLNTCHDSAARCAHPGSHDGSSHVSSGSSAAVARTAVHSACRSAAERRFSSEMTTCAASRRIVALIIDACFRARRARPVGDAIELFAVRRPNHLAAEQCFDDLLRRALVKGVEHRCLSADTMTAR